MKLKRTNMKTIEQNNKRIAEFMGATIIGKGDNQLIAFPDLKIEGGGYISDNKIASDLKYHTSWDWLMPAVEKCLEGEAELNPETSNTTIKSIYESLCNTQIKEVHSSVVQFIEWYNENK